MQAWESKAWPRQGQQNRLGPVPTNAATRVHSGAGGVDFLERIQLCHLVAV